MNLHNERVSAFNPDNFVLTSKLPVCQLGLIENGSRLIAFMRLEVHGQPESGCVLHQGGVKLGCR